MVKLTRFLLAAFLGLAALPAIAEEVPILRIYAYDSFASEWGPGPALKAGFEATCVCVVEFTTAEDAISTLRKVQLEGTATKADIVLGLDTAIAGEARATGLFAPHGLELSGLDLPSPWTDRDFVPVDYGYFAYVYNKEKVPNPPASFEALIALPDTFKIVIQDPRSSTPGLGNVLWIEAAYGKRAPEIWAGRQPHILTVTRGWSEAYGLFLDGEADMVLSYTTSPVYHAVAEDDHRFAAAEFEEGHVAQIEVAGILQSSQQQDLARQFLAYLTSVAGQKVIPTTNWMYPIVDLGADLPAEFSAQPKPEKLLSIDEATITAQSRSGIDAALGALK